jgi:hypothetical protein
MEISIWDHARYVKDRANPYPEMAAMLRRFAGAGISRTDIYLPEVPDLGAYCTAAAEAGMTVEARLHPEHAMEKPPMRALTEAQLQAMQERQGLVLKAPCPCHPEFERQLAAAAERVLSQYGDRLMGLQLDFIRGPNARCLLDYPCGCEACRAERRRYYGFEMPPEEALHEPWYIYKETARMNAHVRATVIAVAEVTHRFGRKLSMAARSNYANCADIDGDMGPAVLEGQDWAEWATDGLLDEIIPMNYNTVCEYFVDNLRAHLRLLAGTPVKFTSGLARESSMGLLPPSEFRRRFEALAEAGVESAFIFNKSNTYSDDYLSVIREYAIGNK